MQRTFDVEAVRAQFPALSRLHHGKPVAYFDGPGGSQVAKPSIDAMARYMERGGANLHGVFPTSTETEEILARTRHACAAFLGTDPDEVAFGANMTTDARGASRARGGAHPHGSCPRSAETEGTRPRPRHACAAFLGTDPDEVAFGANMTTLTLAISRALSRTWDEESEIVVTELD